MADRILLVEDDRELREFLAEALDAHGYATMPVANAAQALGTMSSGQVPDLVITDLMMPGMGGEELLRELRQRHPELNVIAITAFGSIESAIALIKAGAWDYLTKPLRATDLIAAVERGLAESRLRRQTVRRLTDAPDAPPGFVGGSAALRELFRLIARTAHSRHPALVTGESGTGKELVARALHLGTGRGAFVPVNCSALPENLLESELFGHEKGAFTGADRTKPGLYETAHGGTLFLDEIAELPMPLQPKLLRAIDQDEVRRVGATAARELDVRVVTATNRDLEAEVRAGRFREDLYWRINVLHIHVPPLRDRAEDVILLAQHFLASAADARGKAGTSSTVQAPVPRTIGEDAMALLLSYPWPGNVRELQNAINRAATLATTDVIRADDLPPRIRTHVPAGSASGGSLRRVPLRELERRYIMEVLDDTGGNKSRAAEILGLDRKTLARKVEEYRRGSRSM